MEEKSHQALKMVLEKESRVKISSEVQQVISLAGLIGDRTTLLTSTDKNMSSSTMPHPKKILNGNIVDAGKQKNGFSHWLNIDDPFSSKLTFSKSSIPVNRPTTSSPTTANSVDQLHLPDKIANINQNRYVAENENEYLLADIIGEDNQLPSRIPKPI